MPWKEKVDIKLKQEQKPKNKIVRGLRFTGALNSGENMTASPNPQIHSHFIFVALTEIYGNHVFFSFSFCFLTSLTGKRNFYEILRRGVFTFH